MYSIKAINNTEWKIINNTVNENSTYWISAVCYYFNLFCGL